MPTRGHQKSQGSKDRMGAFTLPQLEPLLSGFTLRASAMALIKNKGVRNGLEHIPLDSLWTLKNFAKEENNEASPSKKLL